MSLNNDTTVTTPSSIIVTLGLVESRFIHQLPIIFVILGSIGFIGNAFTFLQPNLRRNSFCIYSLCGSLIDFINLYINLLPDYINSNNLVSYITNSQLCKWKLFGLLFFPQLSLNLLILSLIDRYVGTCSLTSPLRKIQQLKLVPYLIGITVILSSLMSLYSPLLYDVMPGLGCVVTNPLLNSVLYISIHGSLTPFVMLIFVWLTYRNVKKSRQRVGAVINTSIRRSRQQFINMVFIQVITTSFFVLQWIVAYIYTVSTQNDIKSPEQWAIGAFVFSLTNNLYYMINVKSFYLSTLSSRLFRGTFIQSLRKLIRKPAEGQQFVTPAPFVTNVVR